MPRPLSPRLRSLAEFVGRPVMYCMAGGLALGVALTFSELTLAYGIQNFLTTLGLMAGTVAKTPAWTHMGSVHAVVFFVIGAGVLRGLLQWGQTVLQGHTFEEFCYLQRSRLLRWTFRAERVRSDQVISHFGQKTVSAAQALMLVQTGIVQVTVSLLLAASLFQMSAWMTLACFVTMGLLLAPLKYFDRNIRLAGQEIAKEWDFVNRHLLLGIKNLLLLEVYGTRHQEEARAQQSIRNSRALTLSHYRNTGLSYALPQVISVFLVCLLGVSTRHEHGIPSSLFVSYIYLFVRMAQNLSEVARAKTGFTFVWPQVLQLREWWEAFQKTAVHLSESTPAKRPPKLPDAAAIGWKIEDLSFGYGGQPLLSRFNLSVSPGTTTVIVGPSGTGKTSLLSLMLGILKPQDGKISVLISGHETRPLIDCRHALLTEVGYVGPESFLIEGTVRQNLVYGLEAQPSDAAIQKALDLSQCQFVRDLPTGLDHAVSEQGQGLSAGQKQRLSLARALLRNPRVLILDEATSNLDVETESRLIDTFADLKRQMTLVIVTHREAMLRIADQTLRLGISE